MNTVYKLLLDIPFRYIILQICKIISSESISSDKLFFLRLIIRNNWLLIILKNRRRESISKIFIMIISMLIIIKIHKIIIVTGLFIEWQLINYSFNRHHIGSIDFILLIINEILIIIWSSCLIFVINYFNYFIYFLRNLFTVKILSINRL
jgi:hypothetical protein